MTIYTQIAPVAGTVSKVVATYTPKTFLAQYKRIVDVWRQRQHLDRLPQHMRRDIGLTDAQISQEVQRPLWDTPQTWRY